MSLVKERIQKQRKAIQHWMIFCDVFDSLGGVTHFFICSTPHAKGSKGIQIAQFTKSFLHNLSNLRDAFVLKLFVCIEIPFMLITVECYLIIHSVIE